MRVQIGPVPSESTLEYVRFCRRYLAQLTEDPGDLAPTLTPYVIDTFTEWVDGWEAAAQATEPFTWTVDLDPEVVEHLFYAFFLIVQRANEEFGEEGAPGDVDLRRPFRLALTQAVLDALEAEGDSFAEFARHLREYWPDSDFEER